MNRRIALDGAVNVRDIGGYKAESGAMVRWGCLIRGDNTYSLTAGDQKALREYGLSCVVDLRDREEIRRWPSVFASGSAIRYTNQSLYVKEVEDSFKATADGVPWNIFLIQQSAQAIGAVLSAVGDALGHGCTLVHCSAGKDRTGLVVAIVMMALGVPAATIAQDYALSAEFLAPRIRQWRAEAQARGADLEAFDAEMTADPEVMMETLAYVEDSYGGIDGLMKEVGLTEEWSSDIQAALLW